MKALDLFLAGHSPQKVAALLHPGIGAAKLIPMQRRVYQALRDAVSAVVEERDALAEETKRLRAEVKRLKAELAQARAARAAGPRR